MQHAENITARVSRLQARDLPSALAGLLRQAETALRPVSKLCKGKKPSGTPNPQKKALATAIVLLLERAGDLREGGPDACQAVRAQLLAAFQQHGWLWERLVRVDLPELLSAPLASGLVAEVLMLLGGASQARALSLLRLQLARCLERPPLAAQQAALLQILCHAFASLKQCFPVVSYSLPGYPSQAGASQQAPLEGSRVQLTLCEQLPALLHLTLSLACHDRLVPPAAAATGQSGQSGGSPGSSHGSAAAVAAAGNGGGGGAGASSAKDGALAIREGVLRYAALLLQRLGHPDGLHEALGLTLSRPAGGLHVASAALEAGRGRLSGAELSRVQSAQHTMEVLLEALLTLPDFAAAASAASAAASRHQPCSGDASSQAQAQAPATWHLQQGPQERQGGGAAGQTGAEGLEGQVGHLAVALMALHWELAKLRVACSAEPEGKGSKGQGSHLSPEACLQLLRLAVSRQHLAGQAAQRLLASMPRSTGGGRAAALPPVQLLLPPSVMAHLLDLTGGALEGSGWQPSHSRSAGAGAGGSEAGPPAQAEAACVVRELIALVLDIEQACFQGLWQPRLVLQGPLHRQAISAATRLHSLLTQPPAATAEAIHAAAAAAASDMGAKGGLEEESGSGRPGRLGGRKRSLAGSLSEVALAGRQPPAKRSRALAPAPAAGAGELRPALASTALLHRLPASAGGLGAEPSNPVAELLQLFEAPPPPSEGAPSATPATLQATQVRLDAPGSQQAQAVQLTSAAPAGVAPKKRIVAQQVPPQQPQPAVQGGGGSARRCITPAAMQQGQAGAASAATSQPQQRKGQGAAASPALTASGMATAEAHLSAHPPPTGAVPGTDVAAGCGLATVAGPAQLPASAAEAAGAAAGTLAAQQAQQQGGRVYLTGASEMDDAGREALWAAYIADKELMLEMLGDANYQDWFDEAANPLPAHAAATPGKGVDALLEEALGSPPEEEEDESTEGEGSGSQLLPPGPRTLLEASVQEPWQAALAACLALLLRGLGRALAGVEPSSGGAGAGGLPPASCTGGEGGQEGQGAVRVAAVGGEAALAAQLLCGVLGERQRGAAGMTAARVAEPHCGVNNQAMAKKGACSHPVGGVLLFFAMQLHEAVHQHAGPRTAPVLLSAYSALLSRLLPLCQQEEQRPRDGPPDCKKLGRPPLQLLAPLGLRLLEAPRLRPAALPPDSVSCLLHLACPCGGPQEALAQNASLLWGLLQPLPLKQASLEPGCTDQQGGRRRGSAAPPPPSWLASSPCDLPQQLLLRRGAQPAARVAAAEELLLRLAEGVEGWEREGGMVVLERGLAAAAYAVAAPAPHPAAPARCDAPAKGGAAQRRRSRGRGKAAATSAAANGAPIMQPLAAATALATPTAVARRDGTPAEGLLPAIDVCCTAVQWLVRQRAEGDEAAVAAPAWGEPLSSLLALRRLLELSHRLTALCTSALHHLASYLDSPPGAGCPPALGRAALLWALSLELGCWLEEVVESIVWPLSLLPRQQQLHAALEALSGAQSACAELARGLPDAHPAYHALLAEMEGAPSLFQFKSEEEEEEGREEELGKEEGFPGDSAGCQEVLKCASGRGWGRRRGDGARRQQVPAQHGQRARRRGRRRLQDIRNPGLRAMIEDGGCHAEDLEADDLSDLEDFIVHNPSRDYARFFADHFPYVRVGSDDDEEEGQAGQEEEEGQEEGREGHGGKALGSGGGSRLRESGVGEGQGSPAAAGDDGGAGVGGAPAVRWRGRPRKQQQQQPVVAAANGAGRDGSGSRGGRSASRRRGPCAAARQCSGRAAGGAALQQPQQEPGRQPGSASQGPPEAGSIWAALQQLLPGLGAAAIRGRAGERTVAAAAADSGAVVGGDADPFAQAHLSAGEGECVGGRGRRAEHGPEAGDGEMIRAPSRGQQYAPVRSRASSKGSSRRSEAVTEEEEEEQQQQQGSRSMLKGNGASEGEAAAAGQQAAPAAARRAGGRRARR